MNLIPPDTADVLTSAKTVAVIGCSPNMYRTSNYAAKFLMERGYTVIPVNPGHKEILGKKCYPALNEIPKDIQVDIINIFRSNEHTAGVVEEVEEWIKTTGQAPVIWTQLDVSSKEAESLAEAARIPYVKNRCIMVEWERIKNWS